MRSISGSVLFLLFAFSFASCSSTKKSAAGKAPAPATSSGTVRKPADRDANRMTTAAPKTAKKPASADNSPGPHLPLGALQFKYAILLDVPVEDISDEKLFSFIDSWYGTPYRYGGFTKDGIDCSGFTQTFMSTLYNISIPRVSAEQFNQSKRINRRELEEGDLVFFKTSGRSISHVGIYLRNNKFVHASTSSGVMISDLGEDYFSRRFAGSGRVR